MGVDFKDVLAAVQEEFVKEIAAKPTWGKNELLLIMERAKLNAILKFL